MSNNFDSKLRQRFLGENYSIWRLGLLNDSITYWSENTAHAATFANDARSHRSRHVGLTTE
ncbi:hypothetical protein BamMEX5DRAFT_5204 [Burkholderia ambifaria MEX-5]|uniref:Uncharacterized protein n=1 Tax=Burkholderia ambifaria MEX-5 TaxID=396597 RepID=B1TBN8_9BURK|nr:hypothetical protein BamMEX5DRAFT_5204 [Burkholderia ambifaria MEX-5]